MHFVSKCQFGIIAAEQQGCAQQLSCVCAGGQLADDEEEDMDEAPIQLEAPSKIVVTNTTISMRARVACFDCQGKSDARSIREILVQVAPQQLVLIHALPQVRLQPTAAGVQLG